MILIRFTKVLTSFVLSFGLISCAKDSSSPEVTTVPFRIAPPVIRSNSQNKTLSAHQLDVIGTTFLSTDSLAFESLKAHDFKQNPIRFVVNSECRLQDRSISHQAEIQNQAHILLRDVLADELWVSQTKNEQPIHCMFQIIAINKEGSTHRFVLPGLSLRIQAQAHGLGLEFNSREIGTQNPAIQRQNTPEFQQVELSALTIKNLYSFEKEDRLRLLCEGFWTEMRVGDSPNLSRLSTLEQKPFLHRLLRSSMESPRQTCRIKLIRSAGHGDQLVSSVFQIQFKPPRPEINGQFLFDGFARLHKSEIPIYRLRIRNPHPFLLPVALLRGESVDFQLQTVSLAAGTFVISEKQRAAFRYRWVGFEPIVDQHFIRFNLAPGEQIELFGVVNFRVRCASGDLASQSSPTLIGFYAVLNSSEFDVFQPVNNRWDVNDGFSIGQRTAPFSHDRLIAASTVSKWIPTLENNPAKPRQPKPEPFAMSPQSKSGCGIEGAY